MRINSSKSRELVARTSEKIYKLIREEKMQVGEFLPTEKELTELFDVSRTVIREGLRILEAQSIIHIVAGRAACVKQIDPDAFRMMVSHAGEIAQMTVQQMLDVRRVLEVRTVELCSFHRDDKEADLIMKYAKAMNNAKNSDEILKNDIEFHRVIARASRNPLYYILICSFKDVMAKTHPILYAARDTEEKKQASIDCHLEIAASIQKRDHKAACRRMEEHFDSSIMIAINAGLN